MLENNISIADHFFSKLRGLIKNINYSTNGMVHDKYKIKFTYYSSMKNWSHQASIIATDDEVFFESPRMFKVKGMEQYQNYDYNGREVDYKIPLTDKFLVLKVLTEYDRFQMAINF